MLLNVVNKRAGEPQKLIVLLTIIIGTKKQSGGTFQPYGKSKNKARIPEISQQLHCKIKTAISRIRCSLQRNSVPYGSESAEKNIVFAAV